MIEKPRKTRCAAFGFSLLSPLLRSTERSEVFLILNNACIQKIFEMQKVNGEAIWLFLVKPTLKVHRAKRGIPENQNQTEGLNE
jgi:hypothetical protein